MWEKLEAKFRRAERSLDLVKLILSHGLRIDSRGQIYCGKIKLNYTSVADACGLDRRTVKQAISRLLSDPELAEFFGNLEPAGAALRKVARFLNYSCITVEPIKDRPGFIADVAEVIAQQGMNILQLIAEDPKLHPNPKLHIILEGRPPPELITKILGVPGAKSVNIQ